ncbi:MAG: FAD-dependent oxidoreductase [Clostridia bacterium]|nr:FAD-dependent oxidoreductase [Clostridia bacterium]
MYDIIVIGAGPAGLTAALYARRAEKSVLVIEKESFGGQITHSPRVENYPGFIAMSGNELADKLIEQVFAQGAEIELDEVVGIEGEAGNYTVLGASKSYSAKSVIIATGSRHRTLGLPGEEELVGEGISYCAVCDGAFYKGKTVAVIGGGNSALVDAVMLSEGCEKVYVVQNLAFLTGERRLAAILESRDNVEIIYSSVVKSFAAEGTSLSGIVIENTEDGSSRELKIDGMFVAIGQIPENKPFESRVKLNSYGYVEAGEDCVPESDSEGIFVAGDCRTKTVRQVTTATADGAVAAIAAVRFIDGLAVTG